ncbi:MAG: hypothetical protein ACTSO7_14670 [Candidatus Heimdallarchaeota archaeon]
MRKQTKIFMILVVMFTFLGSNLLLVQNVSAVAAGTIQLLSPNGNQEFFKKSAVTISIGVSPNSGYKLISVKLFVEGEVYKTYMYRPTYASVEITERITTYNFDDIRVEAVFTKLFNLYTVVENFGINRQNYYEDFDSGFSGWIRYPSDYQDWYFNARAIGDPLDTCIEMGTGNIFGGLTPEGTYIFGQKEIPAFDITTTSLTIKLLVQGSSLTEIYPYLNNRLDFFIETPQGSKVWSETYTWYWPGMPRTLLTYHIYVDIPEGSTINVGQYTEAYTVNYCYQETSLFDIQIY